MGMFSKGRQRRQSRRAKRRVKPNTANTAAIQQAPLQPVAPAVSPQGGIKSTPMPRRPSPRAMPPPVSGGDVSVSAQQTVPPMPGVNYIGDTPISTIAADDPDVELKKSILDRTNNAMELLRQAQGDAAAGNTLPFVPIPRPPRQQLPIPSLTGGFQSAYPTDRNTPEMIAGSTQRYGGLAPGAGRPDVGPGQTEIPNSRFTVDNPATPEEIDKAFNSPTRYAPGATSAQAGGQPASPAAPQAPAAPGGFRQRSPAGPTAPQSTALSRQPTLPYGSVAPANVQGGIQSGFHRTGGVDYFGPQMAMSRGAPISRSVTPVVGGEGPEQPSRTIDKYGREIPEEELNRIVDPAGTRRAILDMRETGRKGLKGYLANRDPELAENIAANSSAFDRMREVNRGGTPKLGDEEIAANVQKKAQLRNERGMGSRAFATMQRRQQQRDALQQQQFAMRNPEAFARMRTAQAELEAGRGLREAEVDALQAEADRNRQQGELFGAEADFYRNPTLQEPERIAYQQTGDAAYNSHLEANPDDEAGAEAAAKAASGGHWTNWRTPDAFSRPGAPPPVTLGGIGTRLWHAGVQGAPLAGAVRDIGRKLFGGRGRNAAAIREANRLGVPVPEHLR